MGLALMLKVLLLDPHFYFSIGTRRRVVKPVSVYGDAHNIAPVSNISGAWQEIVEQIVATARGESGAAAESNSPRHTRSAVMTRVLFIGQLAETVDFSDPALPPGFDAQKINAGIAIGKAKIMEQGWQVDLCMIPPDETAGPMLEKQLRSANYDCVVIGGGLRIPPKSLFLFERVINAVHKAAPNAAIAFNTRPEDTAEAAARWLEAD
jgi:hypothetical protein